MKDLEHLTINIDYKSKATELYNLVSMGQVITIADRDYRVVQKQKTQLLTPKGTEISKSILVNKLEKKVEEDE
jgi:hypothetical protein